MVITVPDVIINQLTMLRPQSSFFSCLICTIIYVYKWIINMVLPDLSGTYWGQLVLWKRASVSGMPTGLLECVLLSPRAGSSTDNRSKCSDGGGQHTTYFIVPEENFQEMLFVYGILSFSLTKQISNKLDSWFSFYRAVVLFLVEDVQINKLGHRCIEKELWNR